MSGRRFLLRILAIALALGAVLLLIAWLSS
jgi:hypothetical protein